MLTSFSHRKKKSNKASCPTMQPQACMIIIYVAFWELHGWLIISQRFLLAGVEIHEKLRDFLLYITDGPTNRPSYRDARSHLKIWSYPFRKNQLALLLLIFEGNELGNEQERCSLWHCPVFRAAFFCIFPSLYEAASVSRSVGNPFFFQKSKNEQKWTKMLQKL